MLTHGEITMVRGKEITVRVDEKTIDKILLFREGKTSLVELRINDGRSVTNLQRKKYFATINDIAEYTGDVNKRLHGYFKELYCCRYGVDDISMKNCSITEARELINIVMDFVLFRDIPLQDLGINRTDDIDRYLYMCLATRKCCITGRPGDLHHCTGSRIGMGGNRNKIDNRGREIICLSREWHNRVHNEGEEDIFKKYKIYGLKINERSLKKLKISEEDLT